MSSPVTHPEPGTRLGDFLVEGLLGSGGGGTVYAARWGHRAVALKLPREDLLGDASERRRFVEEARILAEINHPGVVRVLGFGDLPDGRPYLAMERLVGESLAERILRGPLAMETALALFDQLAQAVQALHQRALLHRDIKPENVFLVQEERYAVLLDFGIAKPMFSPDSTVTRQGGVRGTPAYMAPERFFGAPASTATDVYELGVLLYVMLTGSPPWEATEDPVTRLNPRRPSELGVQLPGGLEEALLRSLSTRAENRPPTAKELARLVAASGIEPATAKARHTADLSASPPSVERCPISNKFEAPRPPRRPAREARGGRIPRSIQATRNEAGRDGSAAECRSYSFASPKGAVTTASRAMGQAQPAPPLPSGIAPRRRARGIFAAAAGLGMAALLAILAIVLFSPRDPLGRILALTEGNPSDGGRPLATSGSLSETALLPRSPPFDALAWGLHPPDTHMWLRLHYAQMREGPFWKALVEGLRKTGFGDPLRRLVDKCPMDVVSRITWVSLGRSGNPENPSLEAVVTGDFTREAVESCLVALEGDTADAHVVKRLGPVTRVQLQGQHFFVAWPDDRTFLVSTRSGATDKWLTERLTRGQPLRDNAALLAAYRMLDPADTLVVVTIDATFKTIELLRDLPDPQGFSLTLTARGDLALRGSAMFPNEAAATQAEGLIGKRLEALLAQQPAMALILKRTQVSREQNVVVITFEADGGLAAFIGTAAASALDGLLPKLRWTQGGK